jgi:hypothetical protein
MNFGGEPMIDRADLIVQYFNYLISDYDFHVTKKIFDPDAMGNAFVIFESTKLGIQIVIDRSQVLIKIGDVLEPRRQWLEFSDVVKYFAPSIDSPYIFTQKTETRTWDEAIEIQLNRLASILRQYCEPLLKGDFGMKDQIKKIEERRVAELLQDLNEISNQYKAKHSSK